MASSPARKSPSDTASTQDLADASPKPRIASGTLPPQAAQAPEFIPGDRKTSDVSSEREEAAEKKKRSRTHRKRPKAESEAEKQALKKRAMDEEWWSGDDVFVPDMQGSEDVVWSDDQN
ncbi:hypothetical protein KVR01_007246 [Diaporthe batatas]|uniref:uncharacterized protein n=1 Tax=Diaporthe batatas TaxID=748121 RepID=UPI001D03EC57|nr:uncharacterized protein KVR01_007246 [Diaporthe batatas]KAG8162768.1 hypothetical protein KVR01_007246 [Diaporthe batatas]